MDFSEKCNNFSFFILQSGTATGTCGTVSWQIEHLDTRLIVMWSVPFNYNIHDSYFAVGMIFNRGRFTSSSYWFNQMYYSEKGPYKRGHGGQNITFENSAIVVHATMEPSTYHPLLNISVLPQVHITPHWEKLLWFLPDWWYLQCTNFKRIIKLGVKDMNTTSL